MEHKRRNIAKKAGARALGLVLALLLAGLLLAGCGNKGPEEKPEDPNRIPSLEDLNSEADKEAASKLAEIEAAASAAREQLEEETGLDMENMPQIPAEIKYEVTEYKEGDKVEANGRSIEFAVPATNAAAKLLATAWACEVTGEYWRWEVLCRPGMLRQTGEMGSQTTSLMQGYEKGYGYQNIKVTSIAQMSNERLYTTNNAANDAQLLLPYYQAVNSTLPYEAFVDQFIGEGNRVMYFQAEYVNTEVQAKAVEKEEGKLYLYYIVAPGPDGNLIVTNSTQYTRGAFSLE